jgi:hypothetical protein
MVTIYLRSGAPIAFPRAAAIAFGMLPARPDETPAKSVQVVTSTGDVLEARPRTGPAERGRQPRALPGM